MKLKEGKVWKRIKGAGRIKKQMKLEEGKI